MMALVTFLGAAGVQADASRGAVEDSDWGEVEYIGNSEWIRRIGNMDVEYLGSTNWIRRIGPYDVEYIGSTYWIRRIGPYDVEYIGSTDWIRRIGHMNVEYIGSTNWIKYIGNRKSAAGAARGSAQTATAVPGTAPSGPSPSPPAARAAGIASLAVGPDAGGYACPDGRQIWVSRCYDQSAQARCQVVHLHQKNNGFNPETSATRADLLVSLSECRLVPLEFGPGGSVSLVRSP